MKIKYLALLTIFSICCALGCACKDDGEQSQSSSMESSNSSEISSPADSVYEEEPDVVLSVNQNAVTIGVGETFTLIADVGEVSNAVFSWAIDGDAASDVVSLSQEGSTAVITALKVGETKLVVSVAVGEEIYFKTVSVTVCEKSEISLAVSNNVGFNNEGYYVSLSTLSVGGETSVTPIVSVYKNNKLVSGVAFTWQSENEAVAKVEGNKIVSVGEGLTFAVGTCQVDDKTYTVRIAVEVIRPIIALEESFVIETENISPLTVESTLNGIATDVLYNGMSVGTFDMQSKTITLEKSKFPMYAAELGENKQLIIRTNLADYAATADVYTKILRTKEDFETFAAISKRACATNAAIWDGYFILGNDIAYNGLYKSKLADLDSLWAAVEGDWSNGGLYGFRGVFDGKGHNIEGISIDNGEHLGSFIGVLHVEGVIKNLSFTKASVAANSSLVCGAGGGTVENVYVQYDSIGAGAQHYEGDGVSINTHCATFFGFKEPTITANVSNCIVDVINASFNESASIKAIASEYVSIKNTFLIGGSKNLQKGSNATMSFDAVIDFVESSDAQARYQRFDEEFWSLVKGVPVSQTIYEKVYTQGVNFVDSASCLVSGTSYKFPVDNNFVKLMSSNEKVTIQSGIATISKEATNGETVTITAIPIFDETKATTITCSLAAVGEEAFTDLTQEEKTAYYDLTLQKVYFADLKEEISAKVLYYLNDDYSMATFGKDGDPAKAVIAVTAERFYKFNCTTVTKVIEKAEDLQYLRRDYTVSSYGNPGCYDSKILGTFVLVNDIDCKGLTLANSGRYWENSRGFGGVLDGREHTIFNLTVGENGLFGALAYATIKNINFTDVRLIGKETEVSGVYDSAYVCLFAPRVFNTTVENVKISFAQYTAGESIASASGLMFYETSFDNLFKNVTLDISKIGGVKYLTECYYDAEIPYLSEKKSTYENVTVIVDDKENLPEFAYKEASGTQEDKVQYPQDGFTFEQAK